MASILVTGFNKNQCTRQFYLKQHLKVVPSHYSLVNCLLDMGHQVDHRTVTLGEDLSAYDEVIVFIAGPRQLVATHVYEGLYAISQHPTCILAFDDWQVQDLFKGVARSGQGNELFASFILSVNKKALEDVRPYEKHFRTGLDVITSKHNRMLISAFNTGHLQQPDLYGPQLLFGKISYPRNRLFVYNPNPYHRNRTWEDVHHDGPENPRWSRSARSIRKNPAPRPHKLRRFNFASLVQSKTLKWVKRQGYMGDATSASTQQQGYIRRWPVDMYGSRADKRQARLTEDEMVKIMTRDWGCLISAYEHAGSGWWRARPLQCADAGSILIGDEKELRVYYGHEYPWYGMTAEDVAEMPRGELEEVARVQKMLMYKHHPLEKEVQRTELQEVLDAKDTLTISATLPVALSGKRESRTQVEEEEEGRKDAEADKVTRVRKTTSGPRDGADRGDP